MSYDIVAFDPAAAPSDGEMSTWWVEQTEAEQPSYSDPTIATAPLQAFYRDMIKDFPPLNGPDATDDDDADTDYSISPCLLYVCFRWNKADQAREVFLRLGRAHGVGVYEVSESPAVIHRPTDR